jgi:predicted acyl esterase
MTTRSTISLCLLFGTLLVAQDPPTPPAGFGVTVQTVMITFSDGVATGMDIYTPNGIAGPTGWPGVLVMHGADGSKNIPEVVAAANYLTAAGYVAYAYSDPGRPGQTQERDLLDSAESHGLAQVRVVGTTIDPARLAVTGFSGGGRKSFSAAAWSGRPLPLPGLVTHYPVVLAVAPEIAPLDSTATSVPGGVMVSDHVIIDKPIGHPWLAEVMAGNYAGLQALANTPFNQSLLANLATATVPVFAMFAMQDFKIVNNPSLDACLALPQGPKRLFLSTGGGHSTVNNAMERAVQQDLRRRWFDRYLKGIANGVEFESSVEAGMQPTSTPLHLNPATVWEHRSSTVWPPAIAPTRYHLAGTQTLGEVPPAAFDLTNVVNHVVPAAYDINDYVLGGAGLAPAAVTANIAPSSEVFTTAPLPAAIEILGRPTVRLTVDDATGRYQLTAVLAHQDPAGVVHWITAGTNGHRSGVAGVSQLAIDLVDVAQVVPAGHRLVLRLTNLADIRGPGHRRIRIVPYFESTSTTILVGPCNDNCLDLPARPYQAALLPRLARVAAAPGFAHAMQLRAGALRAGRNYLIALGATGEAPGFVLHGVPVPMNFDAITGLGLTLLNTPILPGSAGVLDAAGNAAAGFSLPAAVAPILAGFRFTFTGFVTDAGGLCEVVGGPATLVIAP